MLGTQAQAAGTSMKRRRSVGCCAGLPTALTRVSRSPASNDHAFDFDLLDEDEGIRMVQYDGDYSEALFRRERAAGLLQEATLLMQSCDHRGAGAQLEELKQLHASDAGLRRLIGLMAQVIKLDQGYHKQDMTIIGSVTSGTSLARVVNAESTSSSSADMNQLHAVRARLGTIGDEPTALPSLVARTGAAADVYLKLLFDFQSLVHKPLRISTERFVSVAPIVCRLRELRKEALIETDAHKSFAAPLARLALEADLLEALLVADYKICILKGVDAFTHLARAEQLLSQFLSAFRGAVDASGFPSSGCVRGFMSAAMTSSASNATLASSCNSSCMSDSKRLSKSTLRSSGPCTSMPELEQWYHSFYTHCLERVYLIFGGGFEAAASLGPKQIAEVRMPFRQITQLYDHIPTNEATHFDTAAGELLPTMTQLGRPHRRYLEHLHNLATMPSTVLVGIFANARLLPHLQDTNHMSPTVGVIPGAGMATPLQDSAWLVTRPGDPLLVAGGSPPLEGSEDWWALAFFAKCGDLHSDQASVCSGLEAIEVWRHSREWRELRKALGRACAERHTSQPVRTPARFTQVPSQSRRRGSTQTSSRFSLSGAIPAVDIPSSAELPPRSVTDEVRDDCLSGMVERPKAPTVTCVDGDNAVSASRTAEAGGLSTFRCLIVPLDLGCFQSPLFVGLVARDQAAASCGAVSFHHHVPVAASASLLDGEMAHRCFRTRNGSRRAESGSIISAGSTDNSLGAPARPPSTTWLGRAWHALRSLFPVRPGHEHRTEEIADPVEQELLAFALAASGSWLRCEGWPPGSPLPEMLGFLPPTGSHPATPSA